MSALIDNIKRLASLIKGETKSGANTAARVGGLFEEIAQELEIKYDKTETDEFVEKLSREKLDKVGDGKDVTVTFTEIENRERVNSGEKLSILFGKVQKWFADLKAVAFTGKAADLTDDETHRFTTDSEKAAWSDKYSKADTYNRTEIDDRDSVALQTAKEYAAQKIAEVVNGSPEALDTLQELAAALGNDPNFATSIMALIGGKADLVHTHTDLSNGLVVRGLLQAYNYNTGVMDKAAITMDKTGNNAFGIGPDGGSMRIKYGAVNSIADPTWVNNPITHVFDGRIACALNAGTDPGMYGAVVATRENEDDKCHYALIKSGMVSYGIGLHGNRLIFGIANSEGDLYGYSTLAYTSEIPTSLPANGGTAHKIEGVYTGNGGYNPPSYFGSQGAGLYLQMMDSLGGVTGNPNYHDMLIMASYIQDVPVCNTFAIPKDGSGRVHVLAQNQNADSWVKAGTLAFTSDIPTSLPANGGAADTAGHANGCNWANQLQAYTEDNFTGGNHFIKAIRDSTGWGMRLWTCYESGQKQSNAVSVSYADGAGYVGKGSIIGSLNEAGEVTMTQHWVFAAGVANTSDIRFKRNIEPVEPVLDRIADLSVFKYNWENEDGNLGKRRIGISAQELEERFPEATDIMDDERQTKTVDLQSQTAILFAAVKELTEENKKLKQKIGMI